METSIESLTQMQEISIVYRRPVYNEMPHIDSSSKADKIIRSIIDLDRIDYKEFMWILLLNNANRVLGMAKIGEGDVKGVLVNAREIIQLGICTNAVGVIMVHNHPSGQLIPSNADINLTQKIKDITSLFDMTLLDHLIITSEGYYSFADEGKI